MGGGDRESAFMRAMPQQNRVHAASSASRAVANGRRSLRGNARRLRRQLQNRGMLADAEVSEQHDPAIGKLDGVVVGAGVIHVDLPEASHPMRDHPGLLLEEAQEK